MTNIFHQDFRERPYWWDDYQPESDESGMPEAADVVVVGAGYTGLSAAHDLARAGLRVVVLEAQALGHGASTRNGGQVGSKLSGSLRGPVDGMSADAAEAALAETALAAFSFTESLDASFGGGSLYVRCGRFEAAWTPKHFVRLAHKAEKLNAIAPGQARLVAAEEQRREIGSDLYYGGIVVDLVGALHPAFHYRLMLQRAREAGAVVRSHAPVAGLRRENGSWRVAVRDRTLTARQVVIATNGYTGAPTPALQRRILPIASHMIATEELPADVAAGLLPSGRVVADSRRVLYYYRMSPDGRRMLFGGRSRFTDVGARTSGALLHRAMVQRFPQLAESRITHSWTGNLGFTFDRLPHLGQMDGLHYVLGCNGSGISSLTYLGHLAAKRIVDPRSDRSILERVPLPAQPLYTGNPWFLPLIGGWYRLLDDLDRKRVAARWFPS